MVARLVGDAQAQGLAIDGVGGLLAQLTTAGPVRIEVVIWSRSFLKFDREIRRIVCTANAIQSVNGRIRKAVRAGTLFQ